MADELLPCPEQERLRAALVHSMERFNDIAKIVERGGVIGAEFLRVSALRIERVLNDDNARYHDDLFPANPHPTNAKGPRA